MKSTKLPFRCSLCTVEVKMIKILQDSTSRFSNYSRKQNLFRAISQFKIAQCHTTHDTTHRLCTHPSGQWLYIVGSSNLDGGKICEPSERNSWCSWWQENIERHIVITKLFCYFSSCNPAWLVSIKLWMSSAQTWIFFRFKFHNCFIIKTTRSQRLLQGWHIGSIASRCSENEPALLPRGVDRTRKSGGNRA